MQLQHIKRAAVRDFNASAAEVLCEVRSVELSYESVWDHSFLVLGFTLKGCSECKWRMKTFENFGKFHEGTIRCSAVQLFSRGSWQFSIYVKYVFQSI